MPTPPTSPAAIPTLRDAPSLPGREEYVERQARARQMLVANELDGLLAFGSHGWPWAVRWLADHQSGFASASSFGDKGFSALILPADGEPILVLDQRTLPGEVAVDDARTVESITGGVADALRDAGLVGSRVGIAGEGVMLDRHRRAIESALDAELGLIPADHLLEPIHRIKSPAELECLRFSSAVACAWHNAMLEAVEPGVTEADLVSAGIPILFAAGGFPIDVVIGSGNPCKPQAARGVPSFNCSRPLQAGDLIRIDGFGPVRGYGCDMARSTCVGGEPTDHQREVLEHAVEFIDTLIAAVRPGVTHEQVHDVGTAWMAAHGYPPHGYFEGFWPAFGHQMGLTTEGPFIAAGSTDPIQAGQVLAIEIVVGSKETGGISHEEVVIVHDDGTEVITTGSPKRWW